MGDFAMSTQVVLTLSDDLYERAKQWAALTQRDVAQTLTDALEIVLTPLLEPPAGEPPVTALSDAEVMALAQAQMAAPQGKRLDQLLAKQREDELTAPERSELLALMQEYHRRWIRQAKALAEAVRRGLREPLVP
jgi:hypothetical protein